MCLSLVMTVSRVYVPFYVSTLCCPFLVSSDDEVVEDEVVAGKSATKSLSLRIQVTVRLVSDLKRTTNLAVDRIHNFFNYYLGIIY